MALRFLKVSEYIKTLLTVYLSLVICLKQNYTRLKKFFVEEKSLYLQKLSSAIILTRCPPKSVKIGYGEISELS
jgi:hypothetical protein